MRIKIQFFITVESKSSTKQNKTKQQQQHQQQQQLQQQHKTKQNKIKTKNNTDCLSLLDCLILFIYCALLVAGSAIFKTYITTPWNILALVAYGLALAAIAIVVRANLSQKTTK